MLSDCFRKTLPSLYNLYWAAFQTLYYCCKYWLGHEHCFCYFTIFVWEMCDAFRAFLKKLRFRCCLILFNYFKRCVMITTHTGLGDLDHLQGREEEEKKKKIFFSHFENKSTEQWHILFFRFFGVTVLNYKNQHVKGRLVNKKFTSILAKSVQLM